MSFEGYPPPPATPPYEYWAPPVGPPTSTEPSPPVPRRHRARLALALVAGGAVIAGVSAWTTILITSPSDPPSARTGTGTTASSPGAASGRQGSAAKPAVSGTITAESGSTWTVQTPTGASYTVTIGQDTKFGTVKRPEPQSTFVAGTAVRVTGSTSGTTVDATRVALAHAAGGAPPSATASPSTDIPS